MQWRNTFDLNKKGLQVVIVGLQSQPGDMLRSIDIIPDLIPENRLFENMDIGLSWLKKELNRYDYPLALGFLQMVNLIIKFKMK